MVWRSNKTVTISPTPKPMFEPEFFATADVILGAGWSPQVPVSTACDVDCGDVSSALRRLQLALTATLRMPTRVALDQSGDVTV